MLGARGCPSMSRSTLLAESALKMTTISCHPRCAFDQVRNVARRLTGAVALWLCAGSVAHAQLPFMNAGPDSGFAQIDFAQLYLDGTSKQQAKNAEQLAARQHQVDLGVVSAL